MLGNGFLRKRNITAYLAKRAGSIFQQIEENDYSCRVCVGFEPKGLLIQQWIKKPGFRTGHGFQRLVDIKNREFGKMRGEKVVFFVEKFDYGRGIFKKYTDRIGKLFRSQSPMVDESAEHIFKKYTDQNSGSLLKQTMTIDESLEKYI